MPQNAQSCCFPHPIPPLPFPPRALGPRAREPTVQSRSVMSRSRLMRSLMYSICLRLSSASSSLPSRSSLMMAASMRLISAFIWVICRDDKPA